VHNDGESVALKLIQLPMGNDVSQDLRRRVKREISALQKLDDPAVVKALDHGEDQNYLYIAFELIKGTAADQKLASPPCLGVDDCLAVTQVLARGIDHIHSHQVFHRDIKPANIVLRNGCWTSPVLVDFGLVKEAAASRLTVTGYAVGTQRYLAPELVVNPASPGSKSDLWSFARTVLDTFMATLETEWDDTATLEDQLEQCARQAPEVGKVLGRATSEDVGNRFVSATEFAVRLQQAIAEDGLLDDDSESVGAPVLGRNESLIEMFERIGCTVVADHRGAGGSLWIMGEHKMLRGIKKALARQGVRLSFANQGGRATKNRPAWFTKSDR